ncbi:hypothetical protein BCR34DRAFT_231403 [Clohesyomyces aquaticus]|uniref:Thiaminase-2/PQQC domain-containing protein n=1 Tax=Clohesyomyces aquaticus TaxID=1231657 RepID=A0A1Y1ZVY9_9PLEO|nr:hypothetical protein BCR34DRAFT_231403 [Clohesyomyces aquaticus]
MTMSDKLNESSKGGSFGPTVVIVDGQLYALTTIGGVSNSQIVSSPADYALKGVQEKLTNALRDPNTKVINLHQTVFTLPFGPGGFVNYLLSRADIQAAWKKHTEHEFLNRLADGTLPVHAFKYYLIQDYLYLVHFARAHALAAYKSSSMDRISRSAAIILHIQREMSLHLTYCAEFGVSLAEIENMPESQACTAYTRFILDVGMKEDWFALQIAMAPCLIGYGMIARRLHDDERTVKGEQGNKYWRWIENYVADDYSEAVRMGTDVLNEHAMRQSPSRIEELVKIFIHATNMETGFWDMGFGEIGSGVDK